MSAQTYAMSSIQPLFQLRLPIIMRWQVYHVVGLDWKVARFQHVNVKRQGPGFVYNEVSSPLLRNKQTTLVFS